MNTRWILVACLYWMLNATTLPFALGNDTQSRYLLSSAQPAQKWEETLLTGNGNMGAMVFGAPYVETKRGASKSSIGYWGSAEDWVSWQIEIPKASAYDVTARISSSGHTTPFVVELGEQRVEAESVKTRSWEEFASVDIGRFKVDKPGIYTFSVKPLNADTWNPLGLLEVTLVPARE